MYEQKMMTRPEKVSFFCSNRFLKWLEQMVRMFCRNPKIKVVQSETTATDGKMIYQNLKNDTYLDPSLSKRTTTICYIADVLHENGHIEESCFEIIWAINRDKWDASFLTTKEKRIIEKEVSEYVKDLTPYERHALADVNNIVEDAGMEYSQGQKYGKFVQNAFTVSNAVTMNARPSLDEMENAKTYNILIEAILCYSIMGHIKGTIKDKKARELFETKLMPLCKKGKYSSSSLDRFLVAKEIFNYLLPYLKELENDTKKPYENKAKSTQSGEQKQKEMGKGKSSNQNDENNETSNETRRSEPNLSSNPSEENSSLDKPNSVDNFDDIVQELSDENKDKIMQEIMNGLLTLDAELQEENAQKQKSLLEDIEFQAMSSIANECIDGAFDIKAYRSKDENADFYNKVLVEYNNVIQMFVSYFQQLMKPRRNRKISSNSGTISTTRLAQYRFNSDIFDVELKQKTLPPFSILLLIDASYSMTSGCSNGYTRIQNAKISAIILNEVFSRLKVPFAVISHSSSYPKMEMVCFKNFDSPMNEKFRLGAIDVNRNCGGSRDGYAIRFVNELVKKRSENVIVLSICDGKPTDNGYREVAAQDDTRKAVDELTLFAKKVVGISIGNDEDVDNAVKYIYAKNNIAISDLSMLPTTLLNAII